jgi:hypothetical protein
LWDATDEIATPWISAIMANTAMRDFSEVFSEWRFVSIRR